MQSILLVEDDGELGKQIVSSLEEDGFRVSWIQDGDEALLVAPEKYQLIILDLMLPGTYGLDILKRMRKDSDVPVMILSARNETTDKVRALELGADDFVGKPFWPEELLARVHARLRRPALHRDGLYVVGELQVDTIARQVKVGEESVDLTRVEFDLIAALAKRPGAAITRTWLVENVLDPEREGNVRTLDVHMSRLRKKLGEVGKQVSTVWGVGYRLDTSA